MVANDLPAGIADCRRSAWCGSSIPARKLPCHWKHSAAAETEHHKTTRIRIAEVPSTLTEMKWYCNVRRSAWGVRPALSGEVEPGQRLVSYSSALPSRSEKKTPYLWSSLSQRSLSWPAPLSSATGTGESNRSPVEARLAT
jgi:hypothetical protein